MVPPGNDATHAGDPAADAAMFELGFMRGFEPLGERMDGKGKNRRRGVGCR